MEHPVNLPRTNMPIGIFGVGRLITSINKGIMILHDRIFLYKNTLKRRKTALGMAAIVVLAVTLSFALGYLSGQNAYRTPIIIQKASVRCD